jgi:hypothetical protein
MLKFYQKKKKNIELNLKIEKLMNTVEANSMTKGTTMLPPWFYVPPLPITGSHNTQYVTPQTFLSRQWLPIAAANISNDNCEYTQTTQTNNNWNLIVRGGRPHLFNDNQNGFVNKNRYDLLRKVDNIENKSFNYSNYTNHGINHSTLDDSILHKNYKRYKLNYIKGDLFRMCNYSFVHCVGSDFRMGKGFAVEVRERYGNVTYLRSLGKEKGEVAILPVEEDRYIFYLVTKTLMKNPYSMISEIL